MNLGHRVPRPWAGRRSSRVEALSKCRAEGLLMVSDGGGAFGREGQEGGGRQRETSWPLYMAQARGGGIFYRTPP